jgi:heat shock protein HslJ
MKRMSLFCIVFMAAGLLPLLAGCANSGANADDDSAGGAAGAPTLTNTRWVLASLGETPAEVSENAEEHPYLMFGADEEGVSGSTGVNFLSGTYERDGDALKFGPLITTRRAGPPALMQQETTFTQALERTAGWRIREGGLELLDADGAVVARFRPGTMAGAGAGAGESD